MLAVVSENEIGAAGDFPLIAKDGEIRIESQLAKRDHYPYIFQQLQFPLQVGAAVPDLFGKRLVVRRHTTHSSVDISVDQREAVVAGGAGGFGSKAGVVHHFVEEHAGAVAGEDSAGAVRS